MKKVNAKSKVLAEVVPYIDNSEKEIIKETLCCSIVQLLLISIDDSKCFYNGRGKYLYMKQVLFGFFHGEVSFAERL